MKYFIIQNDHRPLCGIIVLVLLLLSSISVLPLTQGNDATPDHPQQTAPHYEGSREAARIIDIAMEAAREYLKRAYVENITESMVIQEIVDVVLENGGDPFVSAFWSGQTEDTEEAGLIVASGENSAQPHGNYDDDDWKQIMPGEVIVIDIGARYQGRCSDLTRTFFMGEPTDIQREIYGIVKEAHELAAKEIRQFIPVKDLDKIARDHITYHGYGEDFLHSLGHGVGYYIHEPPLISQTQPYGEQRLRLWDVITIEPGIYIQNATKGEGDIFGIRIEDDYGVTANGYERFTFFPREIEEMIILPDEGEDGTDDDNGWFSQGEDTPMVAMGLVILLAIPLVVIAWRKRS